MDAAKVEALPLKMMQSQPVKQTAIVMRDLESATRAYWE